MPRSGPSLQQHPQLPIHRVTETNFFSTRPRAFGINTPTTDQALFPPRLRVITSEPPNTAFFLNPDHINDNPC